MPANRAADAARELARLGGVATCLQLLDSGGTDIVKESAALAIANATQHDDGVCRELVGCGAESLKVLLVQLSSGNKVLRHSISKTIANCSAAEDGGEAIIRQLLAAGVVPLLLERVGDEEAAVVKCVICAMDNIVMEVDGSHIAFVDGGAADVLVPLLGTAPADVQEPLCSTLLSLSESSGSFAQQLTDNGGLRRLLGVLRAWVGEGGSSLRKAAGQVEEDVAQTLVNAVKGYPQAALVVATHDPRLALLHQLLHVDHAPLQTCVLQLLTHMAAFTHVKLSRRSAEGRAQKELLGELMSDTMVAETIQLLDHSDDDVSSHAVTLLRELRREAKSRDAGAAVAGAGQGAGSGEGEGGEGEGKPLGRVVAFVEAGAVPLLYAMMGAERESAAEYAGEMLTRFGEEVEGSTLKALLQTVALDSDIFKRAKVAVAMVYLCFYSKGIKEAFLTDRGLGCILAMLQYSSKREGACSFLAEVLPILTPDDDEEEDGEARGGKLKDAVEWSASHVNSEKHSDLTFIVSPKHTPFHAHKTVLKFHSDLIAGLPSDRCEEIELHQFLRPVVLAVMKALYTNDYPYILSKADSPEFMVQVLQLCNTLQLSRFQTFVSEAVAEHYLNPDSIVPLLEAAIECGDLGLCATCTSYIIDNHATIAAAAPHTLPLAVPLLQTLLQRTLKNAGM